MKEFKYNHIYELAALIDGSVDQEVSFWGHDEDYFIAASTKFSKETLLHQYIVITALNYHRRDFRKNGCCIEEDEIGHWMSLFSTYEITIEPLDLEKEEPIAWFDRNEELFIQLFEKMGEEAFHLLFHNRNFLLKFNHVVTETVQETEYEANLLTDKGTIKRTNILQWVKHATYHRDKGRCVYCNCDLTGIVNLLTAKNFDHMIPLDLGGVNDPCNIQLTCEKCNKSKSNKTSSTGKLYQPWW